MTSEVALIVGAGPGLGVALGRCFARAGMNVVLAARNKQRLTDLADHIGQNVSAVACDASLEEDVARLFEITMREAGIPDLVVFNPSRYVREKLVETRADDFESAWRSSCLGGFLVGRAAARTMVSSGKGGTILFTGSSASLHGIADYASFSAAKCGLRGLAQSMAQELGRQGIHVAHVSVDAVIASDPENAPPGSVQAVEIAEVFLSLHRQEPASWLFERELRPHSS